MMQHMVLQRIRDGKLSRRDLFALGGVTVLAGCDPGSTDPEPGEGPTGGGVDPAVQEAPMLAEMVAKGELPPLAERIPTSPLVVEPNERLGVYGGQWRTALLGVGITDSFDMVLTVGKESLMSWTADPELSPGVVESYEANEDGTEYIFRLREGMRWSDGEPFDADDIVFAMNDVLNNQDLFPGGATDQRYNPSTAEKLDDVTVKISFERPEVFFLRHVFDASYVILMPEHYLKPFHRDYNPDIQELIEQEEVADWPALFFSKAASWSGECWSKPELPTLFGWVPVNALGEGTRAVVERNPYYWKVDPEGRQLPYIDRVIFEGVTDPETILLKATSGELDWQYRHIATSENKPVLAAHREEGGYRFYDTVPQSMNTTAIAFNLTHNDPVKREIFQNQDFRIGMSYAIDRQEIIEAVFQRQGEPWQTAPRPESRFYHEQLAKQYTEYNVDLANQHLDAAGYERDSSGFRLGPDGERISFIFSFMTSWLPEWADVAALLERYWGDVGIGVTLQPLDESLFNERGWANEFDATCFNGEAGGDWDTMLYPMWYVLMDSSFSAAPLWREWYHSRGEEGEEPPERVREIMSIYDQLRSTTNEDQQVSYMKEILDIDAELFLTMGISLPAPGYGVVKNNFHNLMAPTDPGPEHPEQFFIQ